MSSWNVRSPQLGLSAIDGVDVEQRVPLGTIVQADHATLGMGEFIYLKGLAGVDAGKLVGYNVNHQVALGTSAVGVPLGHAGAMAAVVADRWGWFQISGVYVADKAAATSFAANAPLASAAGLAIAAASTNRLGGALVVAVASAKSDVLSVRVMLNRPEGPSGD